MNDHHLGHHSSEAKDRENMAFMALVDRRRPSIAQMRCRSETGHRIVLEAIRDGRPYVTPATRLGEIRGLRTARSTLIGWGCLDVIRGEDAEGRTTYSHQLTERGAELLAVLR